MLKINMLAELVLSESYVPGYSSWFVDVLPVSSYHPPVCFCFCVQIPFLEGHMLCWMKGLP